MSPSDEPRFRRLFPEPGSVTAADMLDSIGAVGRAHPTRPYTMVNFVASADGRAAVNGRSAPLSDPGDRAMFHGLRERVDAVLAGTGTMKSESYGRLVRDPERRARRAARGLAPDPLASIIARAGVVPVEIPLFSDVHSRIVLFTAQDPDFGPVKASVEVVRLDPGELTLTTMMRRLRSEYDVRGLLCEGGPTLFGALLQEGLVDELFLTVSPLVTGGGADPTITTGPGLAEPARLKLTWVLEREGTLFLRYARVDAGIPG